jgi:hypothetical protein
MGYVFVSYARDNSRKVKRNQETTQGKFTISHALQRLQSATGGELRRRRTLLPSVLDRAFKGEL